MSQLTDASHSSDSGDANPSGGLVRSVGFWGLMFVSLGSIIGSGWLLGALNAAEVAGPASIISWIIAAIMLTLLALVFAELGAAYPVAGGSGRFPYFSHGRFAGFTAGWVSWLQAVAIAPIEIEASITYINSVKGVHNHFNMLHKDSTLNPKGLLVATLAMILFTAINLAGAKFLADSNAIVVIWKTAVPILAIIVVGSLSFHLGNFHAGGGFAPFGAHGIFAALPAGVVFALQGFEQCVQLAGEARNPRKDISRAIITAMTIGALLYILLQTVFIGALAPQNLVHGWANPLGEGPSDYGAWYTLALAVGAGWLATVLIIDAVVSPAGTGVVYVATSARLSYALGEEPEMPGALATTDRRGVPVWSIIVAAVVGELCFGPFPSWNKLVNVVTGATALMYAFGPVALASLQKRDGERPRPYRCPWPTFVLPASFCSANLIIYWGGFDYTYKLDIAVILGWLLFGIGASVRGSDVVSMLRSSWWIFPWLVGATILGTLGRYGNYGYHDVLPEWWDLATVIAFSLAIFYLAVNLAVTNDEVKAAVDRERAMTELEEAALGAKS
jgi:amino acid transporter